MAAVLLPRTCRTCGTVFVGGPRAWYCPDCRAERTRESWRKFREKGRKADRPLGSTDHCVRCGTAYTVNSARQKYCPDCSYEGAREADRPASIAWTKRTRTPITPPETQNAENKIPQNSTRHLGGWNF